MAATITDACHCELGGGKAERKGFGRKDDPGHQFLRCCINANGKPHVSFPGGVNCCALAQRCNAAIVDNAVVDKGGRAATVAGCLALGRGLRN